MPGNDLDPLYLLTVREVMDLLCLSKDRVYQLIMSGELASCAIGRKADGHASSRRVRRQAVLDLIAKWEASTAAEIASGLAS